jgi:hypothetical protein
MAQSEAPRKARSTSAEPNVDSPWDELEICKAVVLGEALAFSLRDVPLLTDSEEEHARKSDNKVLREYCATKAARLASRPAYIHEGRQWSDEDVAAAVVRVEAAVQQRLCPGGLGETIADHGYARALRDAQRIANNAAAIRYGQKAAKELRNRAGSPLLTVCCGRKFRRLPDDVLRKHAPDLLEHYGDNIVSLGYGDGCWKIICDTTEPRPPKKYCAGCRAKAGITMNAGLAKNARKRLRDARHPRKLNRR